VNVLDAGGDVVTIPHVRDVTEAKQAIAFFQDAIANVWSPSNPRGENRDADARRSRGGSPRRRKLRT
jgi:2-keto-3-deoxy-L-rhamnonate aldolase RhmA